MNLSPFVIFLCLLCHSDANQNDADISTSSKQNVTDATNSKVVHSLTNRISPSARASIPRSTNNTNDILVSIFSDISRSPHLTTLTEPSKSTYSILFTGISTGLSSSFYNSQFVKSISSTKYSHLISDTAHISSSDSVKRTFIPLTSESPLKPDAIQVSLQHISADNHFDSPANSRANTSVNSSHFTIHGSSRLQKRVSIIKNSIPTELIESVTAENQPVMKSERRLVSNTTATALTVSEKDLMSRSGSKENATGDEIAEKALKLGLRNLTGALNSSEHEPVLTSEEKAYFITFEEWKKQKTAQELKERAKIEMLENGKQKRIKANRAQGQNSNLDYPFGEEMEFEASLFTDDESNSSEDDKSYKGRFNYASLDCAATIVKTNKEAKGVTAILNANKDTYLLNQCKATSNFVVVELCEDILIDEVLIGNLEFFSSVFKDIKISVSDRYPSPNWKVIGEFEAENLRKLQTFHISDPKIWAKFLKVDFLTHYGNEYYCPISSLQVHGKTMMEQFKEEVHQLPIAKDPHGMMVEDCMNEELQNTGEIADDEYFGADVEDDDEFDNCIIRPHLGLEQFLEQQRSVQDNICVQNFSSGAENISSAVRNIDAPTTSASGIQESIYQNIIKRLSVLESNATLSLLYIEEQSKILSVAFESLENRQNKKFDGLIKQMNLTVQSQLFNFKRLNSELSENFEQFFDYQNSRFQNVLLSNQDRLDRFQRSLNFQKMMNFLSLVIIIFLLAYIISTNNITDGEYVYSLANSSSTDIVRDDSGTCFKLHSRQSSRDKSHSSASSFSETSILKAQDFVDRIFHRQRKNGNDIAVNENSKSETESAIAKDGSGIDVVSVRLSQRESSGSINGQSSCGLIDGEGQREEKENLELSNNKRGGKAK